MSEQPAFMAALKPIVNKVFQLSLRIASAFFCLFTLYFLYGFFYNLFSDGYGQLSTIGAWGSLLMMSVMVLLSAAAWNLADKYEQK